MRTTTKNSDVNYAQNIFIVKSVSFAEGERDPFGFDDFAKRLGAQYLPFSGSVAKPVYFLFVAYVNDFLKEYYHNKSSREKEAIKNRLEKLLVYSWKHKFDNLRGNSIIGNSKRLCEIDLTSGTRIVTQNCFAIYTENDVKFKPENTLELYKKEMERQAPVLKSFIDNPSLYKLDKKADTKNINDLLKKLRVSNSLFNDHKLTRKFKSEFKRELKEAIRIKEKPEYFLLIEKQLKRKGFIEQDFLNEILQESKLPFKSLNDWFKNYVMDVDKNIAAEENGTIKSKKMAEMQMILKKYKIKLEPKFNLGSSSKWFDYTNNRYCYKSCTPSVLSSIKDSWDKYKKRVSELGEAEKDNDGNNDFTSDYFFNFRHYAFKRLLKELQ